jgi:L-lysine exporter family protein LysE/ArgO
VYLAGYGVRSFWRARESNALSASELRTGSRRGVVTTTLALTYLNPHVYLDTVVMLGSIANQHGGSGRWLFALGAAVGSVLWFTCLGCGARAASRLLDRPQVWRVIDVAIGAVMISLAVWLATG